MCIEETDRHEVEAVGHVDGGTRALQKMVVGTTHPKLIDAEHAVALDFWSGQERLGIELSPQDAKRLGESLLRLVGRLDAG